MRRMVTLRFGAGLAAAFVRSHHSQLFQLVHQLARARITDPELALQKRNRCFLVLLDHFDGSRKEIVIA